MLVILKENIENLGSIGDVVKVTDGYARNFLLPRNLVVAASERNIAEIEHHKRMLEKKRAVQIEAAKGLASKLNDFSLTLTRKVGEGDKLFGSVSTGDIAEGLKKAGYAVDKRSIQLTHPIKTLGVHPVIVKLGGDAAASVKVWIAKEE